MSDRERIGQQMAALRNEKGYTVRKLAEYSGVSYQNITKIESGKYNVSIDILAKVARVLDAELSIIKLNPSELPLSL